jgi:hypothetical protein
VLRDADLFHRSRYFSTISTLESDFPSQVETSIESTLKKLSFGSLFYHSCPFPYLSVDPPKKGGSRFVIFQRGLGSNFCTHID